MFIVLFLIIIILGFKLYLSLRVVNAEDFLWINIQTDKSIYKIGEPVEINILGYFGKNESFIDISHCELTIYSIDSSSTSDFKFEKTVFNSDNCNKYQYSISQFYSKNITNPTFVWNQQPCKINNSTKVIPENYTIRFGCHYQNWRGSSWEGVYHGSILGYTNISIIS